ncbi:LAMI_0E07602g1_1 [Lachancea mirantina]|uniref:LAMI_0E07602g1_1 n=1 Tax=Lachancea mirantina TaxID=1230905 RepID=A0A1G4JMH0_9SACH|nr:LAMI_0E07602g1_1 [Lachancea mirantina]
MSPLLVRSPVFRRTIKSLISQRCFTSSLLIQEQQKYETKAKKNSKPVDFNPRHLGISTNVYIPPSFTNLPSFLRHPLVFSNAVIRRIYTLGLNTVQIALFRYQSGLTPKFLLWKNNAIETYVQVNRAFAQRQLASVKPKVSLWVEEALASRSKQLPRTFELDWQLVKFKQIPKLVSVQALMIPGRPLEHIQLIYKFNTKQRLIKRNKQTNKTESVDRDVVDYVAFLCDATTNETILIGSVFESKPDAKLPKNFEDDMKLAIERMKKNGDLYRLPPSDQN